MPKVDVEVLYYGLPHNAKDVVFEPTMNPIVVPADEGKIYILGIKIAPTEEEMKQIARQIEESQRQMGNNVKIEVKNVEEAPHVNPETGEVGVEKKISLRVVPADEEE